MTATARPQQQTSSRPLRPGVTLAAAVGYTAAWVAGLAVTSAGTTVTSTGAEVVAAVQGRTGAVAVQYLVTEVVTAVALLVTLRAVARAVDDRRIAVAAAVVAALSTAQGILGLVLALVAVPDRDAGLAGALFETINRTDGVKMLVLAGLGVLGALAGRRGRLPRWLTPVAWALVVTVTLSGLGYLLLVDPLALAAYASLPLLLVWVTGAGVVVARRARRSGGEPVSGR